MHPSSQVTADRRACPFSTCVQIFPLHDLKQLDILVNPIQDITSHPIFKVTQLTLKRHYEMIASPNVHESPYFLCVQWLAVFIQLQLGGVWFNP
jgi:hypothetical protein